MVGTGALLGMLAVKAGTSIAGAAMNSHASNKAAKVQQQAATAAQNNIRQMWGQYQQLQNPYLQMGQNASQMLGRLMLPKGTPGGYVPGQYAPSPVPMSGMGGMGAPSAPARRMPPANPQAIWGQPPSNY